MASSDIYPFSSLTLHGLRLKVRLGCESEERAIPQYVQFDVRVRFKTLPSGCLSDSLDQTICYAQLTNQIRKISEKQEFRLIEHLGWQIFASLKEILPANTPLWIRTLKEKPPIEDLQGGASFTLGDWDEVG